MMTVSTQVKSKLKVVFLHGYTQTDKIMKEKTLAFKTACANYLDIKFVCSPHVLHRPPTYFNEECVGKDEAQIKVLEEEIRERYVQEYGAKESYGNTWLCTEKPGEFSPHIPSAPIVGLEESLKAIFDACREHEADGIMGFSQGGLMTTIAVQKALRDDSVGWKPKFCVLFGAPMACNLQVREMLERGGQIEVPSLHMISENDNCVKPERSYQLLKYFREPEVKFHGAAHAVPHTESKEIYNSFFSRMIQHISQ